MEFLVLFQKPWLHGHTHGSCTQFVFLLRIGRVFEHAALRRWPFFGSAHACRQAFSKQTQSSHQTYSKSGKSNRSRFQKFVHWLCCLNFFDPMHCDLRISCSQTNLNPEVDLPSSKFHRTKKFPKIQFLKKNSDNQSYHCENKFHQYVLKCHFYFGSGVKELTFSTILFSFNSLFLLLFR